jgi:hypothetical protein
MASTTFGYSPERFEQMNFLKFLERDPWVMSDVHQDCPSQKWGEARLNLEAQIMQALSSFEQVQDQCQMQMEPGTVPVEFHPSEKTISEEDLSLATMVGRPEQKFLDLSTATMAGTGGWCDDWPEQTTTLMIRHIPCKYSQRKLMKEINDAGYLGHYDFFYLPMDPRSRANRGFAFINLNTPENAKELYRAFDGKKLRFFNSEKVLAVVPADLQGFEANAAHYASSRVLRAERNPHHRPLFFRPLPVHLHNAVLRNAQAEGRRSLSKQSTVSTSTTSTGIVHEFEVPAVITKDDHLDSQFLLGLVAQYCGHCGQCKDSAHRFCPFCGTRYQ